jgi:hypothetical protein
LGRPSHSIVSPTFAAFDKAFNVLLMLLVLLLSPSPPNHFVMTRPFMTTRVHPESTYFRAAQIRIAPHAMNEIQPTKVFLSRNLTRTPSRSDISPILYKCDFEAMVQSNLTGRMNDRYPTSCQFCCLDTLKAWTWNSEVSRVQKSQPGALGFVLFPVPTHCNRAVSEVEPAKFSNGRQAASAFLLVGLVQGLGALLTGLVPTFVFHFVYPPSD